MRPMRRDYQNAKINVLIKAFLIINKGKIVSAKDIRDWINTNDFGMTRSDITSQQVTRCIKDKNLKMFRNVEIMSDGSMSFFRMGE